MNSRFGSFKLIFHFLIFLIFLFFCVLNVFFYNIYKKDTLLILSNYEKTMQHDHGEINNFYMEHIGEIFFTRENIKERGFIQNNFNIKYMTKNSIYGNRLKKLP